MLAISNSVCVKRGSHAFRIRVMGVGVTTKDNARARTAEGSPQGKIFCFLLRVLQWKDNSKDNAYLSTFITIKLI